MITKLQFEKKISKSSFTANFSKFLHLASSAGPFIGNIGDFNCYKPPSIEAKDSTAS